MKQLNNYITEKLHLKKGIERLDDNFVKFIVVYPGEYHERAKTFDSYEEALKFAKNVKTIVAYCMTQKQYDLAQIAMLGEEFIKRWWDVYKDMPDKAPNLADWFENLKKCAKDNNFMDLFEYEKIK